MVNLYWWLDEASRQAHVVPAPLCAHVFDARSGLLAGTTQWMLIDQGKANRLEVWDIETATCLVRLEEKAQYAWVAVRPSAKR